MGGRGVNGVGSLVGRGGHDDRDIPDRRSSMWGSPVGKGTCRGQAQGQSPVAGSRRPGKVPRGVSHMTLEESHTAYLYCFKRKASAPGVPQAQALK